MTDTRKLIAEAIGTAWLVIGGCGTAIASGGDLVATSLAFGLTVLTMAYAIGHISGCHLNPAVTVGLVMAKRVDPKDAPFYVAAQVAGAIVGALCLVAIIKLGTDDKLGSFAANDYGADDGKLKLVGAFLAEALLTFFFLMVILGSTSNKAHAGFAPLAIGLCLTLIHLISIKMTNTSVNPARSISQALFGGGEALKELWLFIVAPLAGAAAAGVVHSQVLAKE